MLKNNLILLSPSGNYFIDKQQRFIRIVNRYLIGDVLILTTPMGMIAKELLTHGIKLKLSMRATGLVMPDKDLVDRFTPIAFDLTVDD